MAVETKAVETKVCPHCRGRLFDDEDYGLKCFTCGKSPGWVPPPKIPEAPKKNSPDGKGRGRKRKDKMVEQASTEEPAAEPAEEPIVEPAEELSYRKIMRRHEKNKEDMIIDYYSMPLREFFATWHISSNSWAKLRTRWGLQSKLGRVRAPRLDHTREKDSTPQLPPFNDSWGFLVQIEWLQTYKELKLADKI